MSQKCSAYVLANGISNKKEKNVTNKNIGQVIGYNNVTLQPSERDPLLHCLPTDNVRSCIHAALLRQRSRRSKANQWESLVTDHMIAIKTSKTITRRDVQ